MASTTTSTAGRDLLLELKRHQSQQQQQRSSSSSSTCTLPPPYNLKLVRQCLEDLQMSFQRLSEEVQATNESGKTGNVTGNTGNDNNNDGNNNGNNKPSMASRPSMLWHHACIQRHKRCLLTYHKHRLAGLERAVQQQPPQSVGGSSSMLLLQHLSTNPAELEFCRHYQELRQQYAAAVLPESMMMNASSTMNGGDDLPPPASSMANSLQVRCLQSLGQVVLDSGRSVTFTKGSILYLPRSDILEFLQQGGDNNANGSTTTPTLQVLEGEEVDF